MQESQQAIKIPEKERQSPKKLFKKSFLQQLHDFLH